MLDEVRSNDDSLFLSGDLCDVLDVISHSLNVSLAIGCNKRGCKVDLSRRHNGLMV